MSYTLRFYDLSQALGQIFWPPQARRALQWGSWQTDYSQHLEAQTALSAPKHAQKRDDNERAIIDALPTGASYLQMDASDGFDLLVTWRGRHYVVEVKNPDQPWALTENERGTKLLIELGGGAYHIIQTEQHLWEMLGIYDGQ